MAVEISIYVKWVIDHGYFDVLYLIFKLSIAGCCNIEILICLCAIMRRVTIKVRLLNHCSKGEEEGVLFSQKGNEQASSVLIRFPNVLEIAGLSTVAI